ncbi:cytochrome P450 [Yinghuangia sp. ASG 101]|uniref:cytochrome P450 n=1 Tax=Yinghuangia sp. ASG 101 TaxID=2896848 RepID=UPI001E2D14C3|nr:cytochrome P450 [Yinghuangia sp. ASG 101]UGQ11808.1 cytochrome P450 [Yinghuangia sp. ASG 101]
MDSPTTNARTAPAPREPSADEDDPRLLAPDLLADPVGEFGRMREQSPVVRGWLTERQPVWVITRYSDVRAGLRDPRFVSSPASVPGHTGEDPRKPLLEMLGLPDEVLKYFMVSMLDTDPPHHARLRGAVSRAFATRRMRELRPRAEAVAAALLDALPARAHGGTVDLVEEYAYPLAVTVICEVVGVPEDRRVPFRRWGDDILGMDPERLRTSSVEVVETVRGLLAERRDSPTDDLLGSLADGDLDEVEQVAMVLNIVMGSYDNTAQLIANAIAALHAHPDQRRRLGGDPSLLPRAVDEFIRWCGPSAMVRMRIAAEDVEVHGARIRRGDAVQFVLVSANRDPRHFHAPDDLDVARTQDAPDGHLGFGHGIHYCLGASLARILCETAIGALLARHPHLPLAVPATALRRRIIPGTPPRLEELPLAL